MKWMTVLCILGLLLSGCGARETAETVADEPVEPAMAQERQVRVELPGEAAVPAMESGSNRYYICEDYEISLENFPSGDVKNTIRQLSGYDPEALTVLETRQGDCSRYDFVWAAEGEKGERLGRAAILDDGNYHYTLSVLRDTQPRESSQVVWRTVFESFALQ